MSCRRSSVTCCLLRAGPGLTILPSPAWGKLGLCHPRPHICANMNSPLRAGLQEEERRRPEVPHPHLLTARSL